MMRLVIEEMQYSVWCGIRTGLAQTIGITERPVDKTIVHIREKGLNAGILFATRFAEFRESLEQNSIQWRCRTATSGEPRHPDAIAQQSMVQQSVNAAERPTAFTAVLRQIKLAALLVEPRIRYFVVTSQRPENIKQTHYRSVLIDRRVGDRG
jgi:hypothetical protein